MTKWLAALPVFNEEGYVDGVLAEVSKYADNILVINDGSTDGTLDRVLAELVADADAAGELQWDVSVDSTIARAHQHGTCVARSSSGPSSHTGGDTE